MSKKDSPEGQCHICYGVLQYNAAMKSMKKEPVCYGWKSAIPQINAGPKLPKNCDKVILVGKSAYDAKHLIDNDGRPIMVAGVELVGIKNITSGQNDAHSDTHGNTTTLQPPRTRNNNPFGSSGNSNNNNDTSPTTGATGANPFPSNDAMNKRDDDKGINKGIVPFLFPYLKQDFDLQKYKVHFVKAAEKQMNSMKSLAGKTVDNLPQKMYNSGTKLATATYKNAELCGSFIYDKLFGSKR